MRPEFLALITAVSWGVGGYFEKKGLHLGHLSPRVGITIRTAVAFAILAAFSGAQWRTIPQAGSRALAFLAIGGGVVAGAGGMLCFYAAIKGAPLSRVMPIAFTSPLFGALMGVVFGGETVTLKAAVGMLLTVAGIALVTAG